MPNIQNFRKIRSDGRIVDEMMTVKDMLALGWPASKVVEAQWDVDSRPVRLRSGIGLLAVVVPGRSYVAALEELDDSGRNSQLSVFNADGTVHLLVPGVQAIGNRDEAGQYAWFDPARTDAPNVFGIVFQLRRDNSMLHLDIDAGTGRLVSAVPVR